MKNTLEDDSADDQFDIGTQFDFDTLNIPSAISGKISTELSAGVAKLIKEEAISAQDILDLHAAVAERKGNFAYVLEQVVEIIECCEYYSSFKDLLRLYRKNPLHLLFMSGDPDDIVLENSHDSDIVIFGMEHYDIDVGWIRGELGDEEGDTAALMDFDRIIGTHGDDPVDVSGGNSYEDDPIDVSGDNRHDSGE